ncbi:MAG: nucleoside hydrolase [Rhizobiaceae bacterium]
MARKVVIDTDPGIDDAVAILAALASPELDVAGLTTVAGNLGIAVTTRNAGRILALAGRSDIPVIAGADRPLVRAFKDFADIHGEGGLGAVPVPEPAVPSRSGAVSWLAALLLREPSGSVDILALGPLTNVALLLRDYPAAARRIGRVIAMGGAVREPGNVGRAEFNFAVDPEAAAAVLAAGLDLTLIPLDVTRRVRATREHTAALAASSSVIASTAGALIDAYFQSTAGGASRPLHDPCVMLFALRPELFGVETMPLSVSTAGDPGMLSLDPIGGSPVNVSMRVDAEGALDLLWQRLRG